MSYKILTCALGVALVLGATSDRSIQDGGKVEWKTDSLDKGLKLAKEKNLPVMLYVDIDH